MVFQGRGLRENPKRHFAPHSKALRARVEITVIVGQVMGHAVGEESGEDSELTDRRTESARNKGDFRSKSLSESSKS